MKTQRFTATVHRRILRTTSLACSLGALLPACVDAEPRDLGFTQSSDELSVDEPREPFISSTEEFVGRWVGSAEEPLALTEDGVTTPYRFPSGSTRIEVEIALDEQGYLRGRIVFGEGEPPPPPVDAEAGYPVGVGYESLQGYEFEEDGFDMIVGAFGSPSLPPFEGFEYELSQVGHVHYTADGESTVPDGVGVLRLNTFQPLAPWCELQTPYAAPNGDYSCAPDLGGSFETLADGSGASCEILGDTSHCYDLQPMLGCSDDCDYTAYDACVAAVEVAHVNCDQLYMCRSSFCECTESGCAAPPFSDESLTVRRVGDELIGLFENIVFVNARGLNVPLGEVRLQLQP